MCNEVRFHFYIYIYAIYFIYFVPSVFLKDTFGNFINFYIINYIFFILGLHSEIDGSKVFWKANKEVNIIDLDYWYKA